jgi:hypothetical protein
MHIELGQEITVTLKKDFTTFTGKAWDTSATHVFVETELDFYCFSREEVIVTLASPYTEDTLEPYEHVQHIKGKDIRKEVNEKIKQQWFTHTETSVYILNQIQDGVEIYDVDIKIEFEGDDEFLTTDTFGDSKQAHKRALQVAKILKCDYRGIETL